MPNWRRSSKCHRSMCDGLPTGCRAFRGMSRIAGLPGPDPRRVLSTAIAHLRAYLYRKQGNRFRAFR